MQGLLDSHISYSTAVLGTLFSFEDSLFMQLWKYIKQKNIIFLSLYFYLINIVNIIKSQNYILHFWVLSQGCIDFIKNVNALAYTFFGM